VAAADRLRGAHLAPDLAEERPLRPVDSAREGCLLRLPERNSATVSQGPSGGGDGTVDLYEGSKTTLTDDPRQAWKVVYPLTEILLLVLCATVAGAEDFVEIRRWGTMNRDFLRRLLPYAQGIPSHDTLNDTINASRPSMYRATIRRCSRNPAVEVLAERLVARVNHASVPLGPRRAAGRADGFDARELVETATAGS
jgi:hypothetical protein